MAEGEKVGGIYIEIEAETAKLLTGQQQANRALDSIGDHAQKTANQLNKLDAQVSATAKGVSSGFRASVQQAGYQLQDFIVQVQGGQSALVAFSQQGSQFAGAFGPGGAVVGAVIALGSVLAGVLMPSLTNSTDKMKALETAAESLNKIVVINSQGVAALSNDYARLAATNAALATQLRDAAIAKYASEVANARDAISNIVEQQSSWLRSLNGGVANVKAAGNAISTLEISATDYNEAMKQANEAGPAYNSTILTLSNTVEMLSSKFDISRQSSFELVKMLSDLAKNPTPDNVTRISQAIATMSSTSDSGTSALAKFRAELTAASASAANAAQTVKDLENQLQSLRTEAQQTNFDGISKQLETQRIALTKGKQAAIEYGISQQDLTDQQKEDLIAQSRVVAALEEKKKAQEEADRNNKRAAASSENVSQKLANLKQQSELAAGSTQELSREQAILTAQLSLGKGATQEQIALAGQYAAKKWDTANAIKAQAAAEKLLPEARENASYKQDVKDLKTALEGKRITQQQYNQTSEQLEQQHQANLAKIRSQQVVNPTQQALAEVDPVQQLANQHAQELALIQQFEQQGVLAHQNALALKNAADTQYEQQRTAAQWEMLSQQSLSYNMLTSAVDAFSGNASNAITGLLTGTMSAQEAMRSLGNTILNSVINSIVQVGVEALKNYILGQTLGAASVASSVGMAATTASAWAPAAALASLATLGTNAAPASAGITSTVGLASGLALAGGRKNGGPVSPGNIYPVGEDNLPEFVQTNKGLFMIPGDDGRVFSNKDVTSGSPSIKKASTGSEYVSSSKNSASQSDSGGGKQIQVNIQFYDQTSGGQHSFEAQAMQEGNVVTVDAFLNDLDRGGPMTSGIKDRFGLSLKANGAY
ncbi:phage tail protein [Klebsiella oxytoca]|uniref:Phage tail protein n=1 Tax=Klebsiella oxytoca TaxID=571 RepID=A0AAD3UPL2_KLEOX|nr:phage tail protein [Klebsiella oxytoca]ELT9979677.1 phage tail protein [Klebsiella oxytoca]MBL6084008.1 phage tail protein [Klebsiella oxytoca]MBL6248393.1 phage tail protein [Klebsiella oxytoca]MBL6271011.1 phage tail protein [Klebsiella oxytoca]